MERIPADDWHSHGGHVARYRWASERLRGLDKVADVACGVGYGASLLPRTVIYRGYDRPGVPDVEQFEDCESPNRVMFREADLDSPQWSLYGDRFDATICFETLEHVVDPAGVAAVLAAYTDRTIFVSVPTVPTAGVNPYHLHDFTEADIPPLFRGFAVAEVWAQPEELSHVWRLERSGT